MHRLLVPLLAVAFVLAGASSASAASLSLSAADQVNTAPLAVDASGTADAPSTLVVNGYRDATTCPARFNDAAPNLGFVRNQDVPAGPFSLKLAATSGSSTGRYLFCGYLRRGTVQDATASAGPVRYSLPPCPSPDFDITSLTQDGDGNPSATMTVAVSGAGALLARVEGVGAGSSQFQTAGTVTFKVSGSSTASQRINAGQPATVTYEVRYRRTSAGRCSRPDGTEGQDAEATKTATVTFKPRDGDGDGFADRVDGCPTEASTTAKGCPDSDGDGFGNTVDVCPTRASTTAGGCPPSARAAFPELVVFSVGEPDVRANFSFRNSVFCRDRAGACAGTLVRVTLTLTAASAKAAGLSKRRISSVVVDLVRDRGSFKHDYSRTVIKKLRKLKRYKVVVSFSATAKNGTTRKAPSQTVLVGLGSKNLPLRFKISA